MSDYNYGPFEHELAGGTFAKPDRRDAMPKMTTCTHCHLSYYKTSVPHVCAGGVKGNLDARLPRIAYSCPAEHEPVARGEEGEWRVVPESLAPVIAQIYCGEQIVVGAVTTETAEQIVTEHNSYHSLLTEREGLRDTLGRVLTDYERVLKAWHVAANHSRTEFAHCLIVGCQEGQSTISTLRAALNDQQGVASTDQKGGEG